MLCIFKILFSIFALSVCCHHSSSSSGLVMAKVWNAHELAVGEWQVTLRGHRGGWLFHNFDPFTIFPNTSTIYSPKQQRQRSIWPFVSRTTNTLECTLSLCEDGTFVLTPLHDDDDDDHDDDHHHHRRLPIRGYWNVLPNPYCVTDRFYDQVTLESFPREQLQLTHHHQVIPITTVQLSFHCRMWGRYTISKSNSNSKSALTTRFGRKGRMTHGTLVWNELSPSLSTSSPQWKRLRPRPIVASFSAKRTSSEPLHDGWEDRNYFGY